MNKVDLALDFHQKGYNCCQAVVCAFCEDLGLDMETMFKATEGFGLGMGCMNGTCGALSGAIMLCGLQNSDGCLDAPKSKKDSYKISKELFNRFNEMSGSTVCSELKGSKTGKMLCTCSECIANATKCVTEILNIKSS